MSQELPFEPFPFIENPHRQTIISSMFSILPKVDSQCRLIPLPDGDKLAVEITACSSWKPSDWTIVMVHGLCGSHESPYLVRMVKSLESDRVRCIRVNMRGSGSGRGLARHMYHGGRSDDIFEVIKWVKAETPDSPILVMGFSIGGNLVLKMAGELGTLADRFFSGVIAISPPADLYSSVILIDHPDNSIYEKYFLKMMRADVEYRHNKFKELPPVSLPRDLKFYEFDQLYTAPQYGFADARDYYEKCSAAPLISQISVPCRILLAEDDPIVSPWTLERYKLSSSVKVFKTKKGGHMGYLGNNGDGKGIYWLDSKLREWIKDMTGL